MARTLLSFVILAITACDVFATESATIRCGTIGDILEDLVTERISRGEKTMRGEWPFLAALFLVKEDENLFFCGGSLISSKHVLTAAHCVQSKGMVEKLLPGKIRVVLGAYNLKSKTEIGVQQRDVQKIYVHPEWNIYDDKYDADLAILLLKEVVLFTDYIRPVCISTNDTVMEGVQGSVVGWGRTENGMEPNTEFIKRAKVQVLAGYFCATTYPDVAQILSIRTFCGQGKNGNANSGDSGGGFYVENAENEYVFVQHGIVSSLKTDSNGYIDPNLVVVYTNVGMFKKWITDTVNESGLNLQHEFGYDNVTIKGWHGKIVFEDNFDGDTLDLGKWMYQESCGDIFGPNNLQCYVRDNVAVRNGNLVITAKKERMEDKEFTSGRIRQRGVGFTYGAYVVRARLARGDHLWPAIWLLGDETNACRYEEIDIAQYRGQAGQYNQFEVSAHWGRAWYALTSKGEKLQARGDLSQDFHEFAVLWTPTRIEYYIDNELYFETSPGDLSWTNKTENLPCSGLPVPFSYPSHFILNVAVGGNFFDGFAPMNPNTWSKPTMEVDWVRVYQE